MRYVPDLKVARAFPGSSGPTDRGRRPPRMCFGKFEQSISGRLRRSYFVVHQEKLAHLLAVKSFFRTHGAIAKSGGLRGGIGIKSRAIHFSPARPKTHTDDFVGIGLPCDDVSAGAFRRAPARKSRHSKVKASQKKCTGLAFLKTAPEIP